MLIDDLDKLMNEMGAKQQGMRHIDPSIHHTTGLIPECDDTPATPIEPCTGLINEFNALVGDIAIPEDNDTEQQQ